MHGHMNVTKRKWNFIFTLPISLYGTHRDYFTFDECHMYITMVKVKQSRYRPGVAQRVPGS